MNNRVYIILGICAFLGALLFTGLCRDDEFNEPSLFFKYRPTLKLVFYSPTGMSDLTLEDLTPEGRKEELAFDEFVRKTGVLFGRDRFWFISPILIQLMLSLLTVGILKIKRSFRLKFWHFPSHFLVNLIVTTYGIAFLLKVDNVVASVTGGLLIITINYLSMYYAVRQLRTTMGSAS